MLMKSNNERSNYVLIVIFKKETKRFNPSFQLLLEDFSLLIVIY